MKDYRNKGSSTNTNITLFPTNAFKLTKATTHFSVGIHAYTQTNNTTVSNQMVRAKDIVSHEGVDASPLSSVRVPMDSSSGHNKKDSTTILSRSCVFFETEAQTQAFLDSFLPLAASGKDGRNLRRLEWDNVDGTRDGSVSLAELDNWARKRTRRLHIPSSLTSNGACNDSSLSCTWSWSSSNAPCRLGYVDIALERNEDGSVLHLPWVAFRQCLAQACIYATLCQCLSDTGIVEDDEELNNVVYEHLDFRNRVTPPPWWGNFMAHLKDKNNDDVVICSAVEHCLGMGDNTHFQSQETCCCLDEDDWNDDLLLQFSGISSEKTTTQRVLEAMMDAPVRVPEVPNRRGRGVVGWIRTLRTKLPASVWRVYRPVVIRAAAFTSFEMVPSEFLGLLVLIFEWCCCKQSEANSLSDEIETPDMTSKSVSTASSLPLSLDSSFREMDSFQQLEYMWYHKDFKVLENGKNRSPDEDIKEDDASINDLPVITAEGIRMFREVSLWVGKIYYYIRQRGKHQEQQISPQELLQKVDKQQHTDAKSIPFSSEQTNEIRCGEKRGECNLPHEEEVHEAFNGSIPKQFSLHTQHCSISSTQPLQIQRKGNRNHDQQPQLLYDVGAVAMVSDYSFAESNTSGVNNREEEKELEIEDEKVTKLDLSYRSKPAMPKLVACLFIQTWYHWHVKKLLRRKKVKMEKASVVIQKRWRAVRAVSQLNQSRDAAVRIQKWTRRTQKECNYMERLLVLSRSLTTMVEQRRAKSLQMESILEKIRKRESLQKGFKVVARPISGGGEGTYGRRHGRDDADLEERLAATEALCDKTTIESMESEIIKLDEGIRDVGRQLSSCPSSAKSPSSPAINTAVSSALIKLLRGREVACEAENAKLRQSLTEVRNELVILRASAEAMEVQCRHLTVENTRLRSVQQQPETISSQPQPTQKEKKSQQLLRELPYETKGGLIKRHEAQEEKQLQRHLEEVQEPQVQLQEAQIQLEERTQLKVQEDEEHIPHELPNETIGGLLQHEEQEELPLQQRLEEVQEIQVKLQEAQNQLEEKPQPYNARPQSMMQNHQKQTQQFHQPWVPQNQMKKIQDGLKIQQQPQQLIKEEEHQIDQLSGSYETEQSYNKLIITEQPEGSFIRNNVATAVIPSYDRSELPNMTGRPEQCQVQRNCTQEERQHQQLQQKVMESTYHEELEEEATQSQLQQESPEEFEQVNLIQEMQNSISTIHTGLAVAHHQMHGLKGSLSAMHKEFTIAYQRDRGLLPTRTLFAVDQNTDDVIIIPLPSENKTRQIALKMTEPEELQNQQQQIQQEDGFLEDRRRIGKEPNKHKNRKQVEANLQKTVKSTSREEPKKEPLQVLQQQQHKNEEEYITSVHQTGNFFSATMPKKQRQEQLQREVNEVERLEEQKVPDQQPNESKEGQYSRENCDGNIKMKVNLQREKLKEEEPSYTSQHYQLQEKGYLSDKKQVQTIERFTSEIHKKLTMMDSREILLQKLEQRLEQLEVMRELERKQQPQASGEERQSPDGGDGDVAAGTVPTILKPVPLIVEQSNELNGTTTVTFDTTLSMSSSTPEEKNKSQSFFIPMGTDIHKFRGYDNGNKKVMSVLGIVVVVVVVWTVLSCYYPSCFRQHPGCCPCAKQIKNEFVYHGDAQMVDAISSNQSGLGIYYDDLIPGKCVAVKETNEDENNDEKKDDISVMLDVLESIRKDLSEKKFDLESAVTLLSLKVDDARNDIVKSLHRPFAPSFLSNSKMGSASIDSFSSIMVSGDDRKKYNAGHFRAPQQQQVEEDLKIYNTTKMEKSTFLALNKDRNNHDTNNDTNHDRSVITATATTSMIPPKGGIEAYQHRPVNEQKNLHQSRRKEKGDITFTEHRVHADVFGLIPSPTALIVLLLTIAYPDHVFVSGASALILGGKGSLVEFIRRFRIGAATVMGGLVRCGRRTWPGFSSSMVKFVRSVPHFVKMKGFL